MSKAHIAVIGGSGLSAVPGVKVVEELVVPTPFGSPSDAIEVWDVAGRTVAFLPRHGRGHRLLPTEVPSQANMWALKSLGVEQIIAFSAVGSLQEDYRPGEFVLCDQLIDRTWGRTGTFFGDGIVGHVGFADPYCAHMRDALGAVLQSTGVGYHGQGTLVVMEGPLFSTRAESQLHRSWGAHLIGMTALPEARLAREAEICFATIAMVTDYDCWKEEGEDVSARLVEETMRGNGEHARKALPGLIEAVADAPDCVCRHAAEHAMVTRLDRVPLETRQRLDLLYGKYWGTT